MEGAGTGETTAMIVLDVAGEFVRHGAALDVMTTVIKSPLFRVDVVYILLVAPGIFVPPFFHWYDGDDPP
jgi:hypothetical protein